jgi:hypothetical protein
VTNGIDINDFTIEANLTDTKYIHIHNAEEKDKGSFKCEYIFNAKLATPSTYTIRAQRDLLTYKNSGLNLNFSYSLMLSFLISVLYINSK